MNEEGEDVEKGKELNNWKKYFCGFDYHQFAVVCVTPIRGRSLIT